ncbi:Nramp family divalent metal transporter [Effusibacillus dendaii]|uniref:Divalent metal cation transporter MntH n=1 Tax=Effusibacillus dendaii TaxID=2743772 RepID=A0A7I8DAH5_9BACL|nr:Nramp family divalent metal transporter [Effusibacillus dendaii]BCJ86362.1 divalent metal cation transporter MntH [Effusibacillus dendaii]
MENIQPQSFPTLSSHGKLFTFRKLLPFLGPAFIVSVGYIDPGNWATNIAGGSSFGYKLLWVLLLSNLMAILLQVLAAKLGIATGRSLAENCRENFAKPIVYFLWITATLAAMATDLAEFLGAALGFKILLNIPMFPAALIAGVAVFFFLWLKKFGHRSLETVIFLLVALVGIGYLVELFWAKPDWGAIGQNIFVPSIDSQSILVAIGMLGATVMPHNIFLHSDIVKSRLIPGNKEHNRNLLRFTKIDSVVALNLAWFINSAMIIMAAAVFFKNGIAVESIEQAHATLTPLLGTASSMIFGIALLSAGLSSATTGTMAGQSILEGFMHIRLSPFVTRLITMIPALVLIGLQVDTLQVLVLSQVVLSLQLPFTIVPLILFTRSKKLMGEFANKPWVNTLAYLIAAIVILLNGLLLYQTFGGKFTF